MYELMVRRDFVAQHYLTVPDCGPENEWHSHHFDVEVALEGDELNEHGYLVDIVEVEDALEALVDRYEDATLNDLPEFERLNPSIEHFSRIFCTALTEQLNTARLETVTVKIWEDDTAWASYTA
ncbi:6-pyruvoyltetrahydropterin/6-carboxytetrahydropterin synthase [Salinibacter ruber]|uniref:6-pyruvoyl trahydropterin synthase family protein n=1 Tax=Salinibacter ruber TaxID=146919 RepID=UPI0021675A20|nr:6-carboxytetrahydropterin synthase [Salinibacter ruber]MCS3750071.1 6-pyruvoyltetrahydropterin/6-carboxytetrahydropterin synthase [Salinibacter ruber]